LLILLLVFKDKK